MKKTTTRTIALAVGLLGLTGVAFAALGGTTKLSGLIIIEDKPGSSPTCATSTVAGELCVEGDLETNGAIDVAGAATLRGAVGVTGALALSDALTLSDGATLDQSANNVWSVTENSEDITFTHSGNLVTIASTTSATIAITPATTITGDLSVNGGAGALTLSGSGDSSVVLADNDSTALVIGATGNLDVLAISTLDAGVGVTVNGAAATFNVLNGGVSMGWTAKAGGDTACNTTCSGTGACVFGLDVATVALVDCASAIADTCICAGPAS